MPLLTLTEERRLAFEALARDLQAIFGSRFVALTAYGLSSSAAFVESIAVADLASAARLADRWRRAGLDVPLVITPGEFRRSLDAFPVEYGAILRRHVVIAGVPPFEGAEVRPADLRRALEVLAKGHVLHMRAGAIATGGRATEGRDLIAFSIDPFRALLANAARLHGDEAGTDEAIAAFAARELGLPAETISGLLLLDDTSDFDPSAVMPVYLEAAERLWQALDAWKARER
ncbi:MAG TPA: hypothetical protein VML95_06655 [Longimicrobiales bacterium]|nr:hypothetical protein [Longimicrobiales bacterium]